MTYFEIKSFTEVIKLEMMDIENKIVISDMDGTLLRSDKSISQMTKDTVDEVRKNNIDFTIATGRIYPVVIDTVAQMKITKPLILCNGAIIQDPISKQIYYSKHMDDSVAYDILKLAEKSGAYFYYYTYDSICAKELKYTTKFYYEQNKILKYDEKIKVIINPKMLYEKLSNIYKIVVIDENIDNLAKIRQDLKKYQSNIEIVSSYWNNIEIVANGISKGRAVEFFAQRFGYDIKNIMCIGDEENDESMIKVAGFSVAMGNASENIKKLADFITDNNDNDGISKAIREFAKI